MLKIQGPKGTKVKLTIVRDKKQQLDFTITRDTIHVPSVESKILEGNIGYMQVSQFSDDTDELALKVAQSFREAGVNKVILDLRDNPGGEVSAAVGISGLWLKTVRQSCSNAAVIPRTPPTRFRAVCRL